MSYLVTVAAIMVMVIALIHGFNGDAVWVGSLAIVWVGLTPTIK